MVAPDKLATLLTVAQDAVREMQQAADALRRAGLPAPAAYLESAATGLSRAEHTVRRPPVAEEPLATLLGIAGKSVRAMQAAADTLREADVPAAVLEIAATALAKALHDASQDTIPIRVEDITGDGD